MTDPKAFAGHMAKVLAGVLIKVTEEIQALEEACPETFPDDVGCGTCPTCHANRTLESIGSDAGLALAQAIAHQKELGGMDTERNWIEEG